MCSDLSVSILNSMQGLGIHPVVCKYGITAAPLYDLRATLAQLHPYDVIIFNAASKGYVPLIEALRQSGKTLLAIYHGSFCSLSFTGAFDETERENLALLLSWQTRGLIGRLGFVNQSSAQYFASLGYDAHWAPNVPSAINLHHSTPLNWLDHGDTRPHIGVFGSSSPIKNTLASIAIALAVKDGVIHTLETPPRSIPGHEDAAPRIVAHGFMPRDELLEVLGRMHVSLMMSFSEAYGLLMTDSMTVGTPCIVGPACKPLLTDFGADTELARYLYVERADDAREVVERIELCIRDRGTVSEMCKARVRRLIDGSRQIMGEFLDV